MIDLQTHPKDLASSGPEFTLGMQKRLRASDGFGLVTVGRKSELKPNFHTSEPKAEGFLLEVGVQFRASENWSRSLAIESSFRQDALQAPIDKSTVVATSAGSCSATFDQSIKQYKMDVTYI